MRAAVLREGRVVYRDDVPEPVPGPGQVLVAVRSCGICGSDLHFAAHRDEMLALSEQMGASVGADRNRDIIMGHEFSAEVIEAGPDTDTHPPGTLVTSTPVLLSAEGIVPIGFTDRTIGGYAERMLLSAPLLLAVPNGLDPRHAALTEPMAVGLHAVNKSTIQRDETALVLGCGPIGIAIIAALRVRGVETIVASDFSIKRRELAATMGAHQTLDPAQGSPFDTVRPKVVFEAVGYPASSTTSCGGHRRAAASWSPGSACSPTPCTHSSPSPKRSTSSSYLLTTQMNLQNRCAQSPKVKSMSPRSSPGRSVSRASERHSTT